MGNTNAVENYLKALDGEFGKGSAQLLSKQSVVDVNTVSTGIGSLDRALGVPGIPRGRIIEIAGPEASGKTSLALQITGRYQAAGDFVQYIDVEHALEPSNMNTFKVHPDLFLLSQPSSGEEALNMVEFAALKGVPLVVVDSVAALTPQAEIDGGMGDQQMGLQARLMSKAMRKIKSPIAQNGTTVIFINQFRNKIGVFYGNPEETTGGRALRFFADLRIDIRRGKLFPSNDDPEGQEVTIKIIKNKFAPPFRYCNVLLRYGVGFDSEGADLRAVVTAAIDKNIITQTGAWFNYGEKKWQGMKNVLAALKESDSLLTELNAALGK
jgi:recombination protein RecA